MKKIHAFLCLSICVLCTSCASIYRVGFPSEQLMKIRKGMSQEEVIEVFGNPALRRFDTLVEEWEYRKLSGDGRWSVAVVCFVDDQVVELNTFHEQRCSHPESGDNSVTPPSTSHH